MGGPAPALVGRPLVVDSTGNLKSGEPLCLRFAGGRIEAIEAWGGSMPTGAMGHPDRILAPGLSDLHVHVLAAASAKTSLDLGSEPAADVAELLTRLREESLALPPGNWLRAHGFDHSRLKEGRAPTGIELEAAMPGRPVRLRHSTLHASVLSPAAVDLLQDVVPESATGNLWVGFERVLSGRTGVDEQARREAIREVGAEFVRAGITAIDDITATNDARRVGILAGAVEEGWLPQRVRVWLRSVDVFESSREAARGRLEIAGVKLLPVEEGEIRESAFFDAVAAARLAGLPVAIHVVEPDAIVAALDVLERAPRRSPGGAVAPDRLEHCSLCPPEVVARMAALGVAVVTQPAFLAARDWKYRREVEAPLWSWLYPIGALHRAGVEVGIGSDLPVVPADAGLAFRGALFRCAQGEAPLGSEEAVGPAQLLGHYTQSAARIRGDEDADLPWLGRGARADFALLRDDPTLVGFAKWRADAVIVGGRPVGVELS